MKPQTEKSPLPLLLLLVCVLYLPAAAAIDAPVVHTQLGSLSGQYMSVRGREPGVHAYLGIPYGKPPIGPLRLSAPQAAEGWDGVRDSSKQPPLCIQNRQFLFDFLNVFGAKLTDLPDISEDCLYLNIYTPATRANNSKFPVMVWIHGGGFSSGSASVYDGSGISAYQNVVVVLIQYRLGLLGYLSTGDEHIPGNFGMLDQVLALQWVQKHIHNFGGDPTSVTIFGESAGGVSVSLLLLSPVTDGLFHKAIAESGTAAMDALVVDDPLPATKVVANMSGCSIESTSKIASCLRNLDIDTIVGLNMNFKVSVNVDGHFLTKPVHELFQKHELLTLPLMTGVNTDEGGWLLPFFTAPPNWTEGLNKEQLQNFLSFFFPNLKDATWIDQLIEDYAGNGEDHIKNRDALTELLGDLLFYIPAIKTVKAHRDAGAPVYLYQYHHAPSFLLGKRPSFVGSDHGDEIFTVLGYCFTTSHFELVETCTEEDETLSRTMMRYWGNFARTGSPNGEGLVHWPQYSAEEVYLAISATEQVTGKHLKQERFDYFTQALQKKIRKHKKSIDHGDL